MITQDLQQPLIFSVIKNYMSINKFESKKQIVFQGGGELGRYVGSEDKGLWEGGWLSVLSHEELVGRQS